MIFLSLPIYYKKDLVGMNKFRNYHFYKKNEIKKHYHKLIETALKDKNYIGLEQYKVHYKLHYKTASCDAMNIISMIDKFLNDALQEIKLISNDNVGYYKKGSWEVAGVDKLNPRIEIEIEELL